MGTSRATPLTGRVRLREVRNTIGLRVEVQVVPPGRDPYWRLAERADLPKLNLIRRVLGIPPVL